MTSAQFDYAPLLPAGLPAPAARWTGLAKYSFVGGNNDPDGVPVDDLVEALMLGGLGSGHYAFISQGRPIKVVGKN